MPTAIDRTGLAGLAFSTLGCSGESLDQVIELAARTGFGGVELRAAADEFLNTGLTAAERAGVRQRLESAGLVVLSVCSYVGLCAQGGEPDREVATLGDHLRLAADIGAGAVRVFMRDESQGPGLSEGERLALDRLLAVHELSRELGVRVLIETHDSHSLGARVANFLSAVDERIPDHSFGVIWDTAHTWSHGETAETSLELLGPWLAYLQIKDADTGFRPVSIGAGEFPIGDLLAILQRHHWRGWLSLEWERKWHPHLPSLDEALPATRAWIAAATP
ncbi:sugar phosphate isomerase/epimerase [Microlunatus panaciterrae]|uniref:Sugar phosphate isomerase/epimerase n=1 Tax=Microlunatus panaciterrae TaxID=400768 RepID=A0ABS2RFT1_9ACTN|nr:sugar phosphate isomerase/epimerase family protein [Microlunatus panaciterrae]MBM7797863.1 sugar phosphate isomerase/epimerase [Microlunatus panaciterrae]